MFRRIETQFADIRWKMREKKRRESETVLLRFLYHTKMGRCVLKLLVHPLFSRKMGIFLNSRFSRWLIPIFVRKYHIDLTKCKKQTFDSFNDFFTRERNAEGIDITPEHLISPCDGYLSIYPIEMDKTYKIKHIEYSVAQLLENETLANHYAGGYCLIFRLTPQHYHRFCYICDGIQTSYQRIKGKLHCVRPIAYDSVLVFVENSREYAEIDSYQWGKIVQMEVGALLVGKIHNYQKRGNVLQGQEKGYFEFGGSTIVVLLEKDRVQIKKKYLLNSMRNRETEVHMGNMIGKVKF